MKLLVSLIILGVIWFFLTEGRMDSWTVGGPVVLAATVIASKLASRRRWRWSVVGFLQFAPYFAHNSLLGGLDVAWRSVHRALPIDPRIIEHQFRLPDHTGARVFFMNVVNLLPGTVSADVCHDVLKVHVIDGSQPSEQRLAKLESIVASLFATPLDDDQVSEGGMS